MRTRRIEWAPVAAAAFIALAVAGIIWAVVVHVQHSRACERSGGRVEERWEYASIDMTYSYDSKGNITSVTPVVTQHYSYHCWVNGQETDSW